MCLAQNVMRRSGMDSVDKVMFVFVQALQHVLDVAHDLDAQERHFVKLIQPHGIQETRWGPNRALGLHILVGLELFAHVYKISGKRTFYLSKKYFNFIKISRGVYFFQSTQNFAQI